VTKVLENGIIGKGLSRRRAGQLLLGGTVMIGSGAAHAFAPPASFAAGSYPDGLPRATPESVGIDPQSILDFFAEVDSHHLEMNSFMLARHGKVVAEAYWWPYRPDLTHMMHSFTKSVTVSAVGMALAKGAFRMTDKVVSFFPDHLPSQVSENLAAMNVEDLLTMRTGHNIMTSGGDWRLIKTSWVTEFFKIPVVYKPGTTFCYTSAATYMLSAIFSKTMGMSVFDYLKPTLFAPLGIHGMEWEPGPEDISPGANGLSWHTSDMMKLGLLYQQGGKWNGQQILPPGWAEKVHEQHVPGKYGYQFWLGPDDAYYADGLFCQYSFMFPSSDAVLTTTAAIDGGRNFEPLVWKHFPKAFQKDALPKDAKAVANLRTWEAARRALPVFQPATSPLSTTVSGRTFTCEKNDDDVSEIRFDFQSDVLLFSMTDNRGEHIVKVGLKDWLESFSTVTGYKLHHDYQPENMRVVAGGVWKDANTFEMTWLFTETSFRDTVVCKFDGKKMTLDRSVNVNWKDHTKRPTIGGTRA
jgi:CubicO group peptidase (beta-lactamase class C family)